MTCKAFTVRPTNLQCKAIQYNKNKPPPQKRPNGSYPLTVVVINNIV